LSEVLICFYTFVCVLSILYYKLILLFISKSIP